MIHVIPEGKITLQVKEQEGIAMWRPAFAAVTILLFLPDWKVS